MKRWLVEVTRELRALAEAEAHAAMRPILEGLAGARGLSHEERLLVDNNLAWVLAHDGDAPRAVAIAESLWRRLDETPSARLEPYVLGTLGIAYLFDGRPTDAVEALEAALARPLDDAWARAAQRYCLGEALARLGRVAEARAHFTAVRDAPSSKGYGPRAAARLRELGGGDPYR